MADSKVTGLTAIGSVAGEDLVFIVDDPAGSPLDRKASITQILAYITSIANTYTAGAKQSFQAGATNAGIRLVGSAGNPSALSAGDMWYRTDTDKFIGRNTVADAFVQENKIQTVINKTIAFGSNTLTNVMSLTTAQAVTAGIKKTFQASATTAGFNLAGVTSDPSGLSDGDVWRNTTSTSLKARLGGATYTYASPTMPVATITFVIDGGGSTITTGVKGYLEIPFACTITQVTMLADQSGSIVVDVWKDTYANYPPVDADSITASAVPTISSAVKSQDATLTGWTTSIAAGDILGFNVDSATTVQRVTISLRVTKT